MGRHGSVFFRKGSQRNASTPREENQRRPQSAPAPVKSFGVFDPVDAEYLESKLTPHPLATFTSELKLNGPAGTDYPQFIASLRISNRARRHDNKRAVGYDGFA
jgi:hypothetical protein